MANIDDTDDLPASSDEAKAFAMTRVHMTGQELYSQFSNYYTCSALAGMNTQKLVTNLDQTTNENSQKLEVVAK